MRWENDLAGKRCSERGKSGGIERVGKTPGIFAETTKKKKEVLHRVTSLEKERRSKLFFMQLGVKRECSKSRQDVRKPRFAKKRSGGGWAEERALERNRNARSLKRGDLRREGQRRQVTL